MTQSAQLRPPPALATRAILIVCVVVQLLMIVRGDAFASQLVLMAGLVPARITGTIIGIAAPVPPLLTFVTSLFLHGGIVHLAMNMVFLLWVGRQVEWALGPVRLLLLFLIGGVAGNVLQVAAAPASTMPVIGASGGISAIFATFALLFARSTEHPARLLGVALSAETVRALRYAALWIGLQFLTAAAFNLPGAGGIAIWAHIGGFLFGLLFGLPYLRRRNYPG